MNKIESLTHLLMDYYFTIRKLKNPHNKAQSVRMKAIFRKFAAN